MELYLSACSKTANVAAKKAASSSVAEESQQCGDLFRPSYGFNLNDPYCRLLETQYKSLHDPHLRTYYKRKDILRRLKKGGYITSNNKWREKGREIREVQVLRILVLKPYLDMISKELEQLERTAEEQRLLRMDREERRQREYARKKLSLRRKIEEEWKTKEMLLLTKIGEDVKREQRVEEQRRRSREESDRKITSEELNSIIQNIMTWVVATVTSILYPAITKYEERVQSNTYPVSDDSDLSSDSSSFCSTCSEGFTYRSYTPKTYQADPCIFAGETPVKKPPTPLKPPSAHVERTVIEKTYHMSEESISSQVNYNETSLEYPFPKIGSSKSDSHLMTSLETSTKISKDATTETDTLEIPLVFDQRAKALDQMKNLKNVFVNFKCHLKGETQLILESIFQEIMSDLSQAIPSLSSVTAEVFVDQCDTEREEMLSNVDICSVASEIVENMLEKLESAVEKQCVQMFSQEDLAVELKPSLSTSGDYLSSLDTKPSEDTLSYTLEPMCDIADDMVHAILEKLMTLASYKKSELPPEDTTNHFQQQINTEPTHKLQKKPDQKRSSPESDAANLIMKEEMQNLISSIFSQSSLVGHVEEAISTILGYVQTELNNERLIASEETVVLLQLLDDVLTQLHPEPAKASVKKHRQPRVRNLPDTEEKYRVTGSRSFNGPRTKRPFPPVNVPGMVLYSEDDDEEIDNLVKSVLDSSFSGEKTKPQEQITNHSATKRDTCFERKRSNKQPTETSQSKAGHHDWGLGLKLSLSGEDIVKTKHCLTNDASIFSQDQKHEIQKASENIVKHILTEMFKDMSSDSSHYSGNKIGEETSDFILEKSQGLQNQEWMEQMFSRSEICAFAHEITDSVINILHKASKYIPHTIKNAISSVHQSCLEHSDTPQTAKEIPTKTPFKVWFDSEKKMKYLSSLNVELEKTSQLRSGECEPKRVNDITDKIINTIFKSLTLFVCPKLQRGNKPSQIEKSLHSQLSTYTMKIVNIVLHAIQNELGLNNINPNTRDTDHIKCHASKGLFADPNEAVDSHICSVDEFMESPLLTCICEMISCTNEDQTNTSTSTDKTLSTLCGSDNVNKQNILSSKQDKTSFRKFMATPCIRHSTLNRKDLKDSPKLKVLDQIGETLHEMLSKLPEAHHDSQPSSSQQNTEKSHKDPLALSNVQLISKTILDYVLAKLCDIDQDKSIVNSELKTASESLDIDNLSFASIMEEMAKCTYMISNTISKMVMGKKEIPKNEAKNDLPVSSKTENSEEMCPDKLKAVASDILNVVFAKLELFAGGNEENVSVLNDENKKETMMDCECESRNSTDSHDKSLQSTLYNHAKKVSSAILKAIQTELNIDPSDCKENIKSSTQETQIFTKIVDLILDVVSSDMFTEPESENRGTENYGYRPIYGNFLPGGAEPESFLDSDDKQNKEFIGDRTSPREETSTFSTDQWILERTLNKIEVKLKEPHKSPIVPIIRNILNEIFQSALINQLNVVSLSHSHFTGRPHNIPVSTIQTSAQFRDPLMGPLVSDTDVTVVVNDVVRTVFHKLFSAAMTEKPVSENRCETIIFSTNVSFREHTYTGNRPVTMLSGNPCDIQSSWNVDKQTKINVVEDIVQAILQNLENFAASKVESLFHPQINFRVPVTLPVQQQEGSLSTALSGNDSYSDKQFPCSSVEHGTPGKMDSWCQLSLSRLNIYAKEVARKILQGIKYELDKEQESPLLTNNVVVSENIASQIVNTVLDIVSCKSKCDKNSSDQDNYSDQQDGIIERLVNKADYRKILEFQIQDTIEGILCDIYENIIHQNNLSFATPTLQYSIPGTHSEVNIQPVVRGTNIIPKVSVPKTDVILVSKDIVNIVLRSLTSLVMLAINAKDPASTRLAFCDMFPKSQCQQSLFITQRTEEKPGHFSHSEDKSLAYADVYQMPMKRKEDTRELTQDPCEENANFITETIFNRLQSFATERINSLISPALQSNKENVFISPKFENGKHDDSIFHEPGQVESGVNVLRLPTTEADPSHELVEPVFSSCGESLETTIHLSQTTLKDYADFIASAILKLIKNDLDLETQREIVTRVLSKIFSPKPNTNAELENMTQKIVNSVNNRLNRAKIPILCDKQSSFPFGDADIVDELVTSVYRNVLKQHGLDPDIEESENSDAFVENIAKLIIAAISDYLLHPLFSGDLSAASCSNSMADNIVFNVLDDVNNSSKPNQYLPPYNTLLPYTFLEDMIRVLLSKFFPLPKVASNTALKDKGVNFNEIASNLISDIRRKISQHEIRFSKDEDKAKSCYSEDDVRHLVDSVFTNILENSDSQESVEENITKSNDVLIDKIAGFIIKYVCEHHLQPFVEKRQLASSTCECFDDTQNFIYASAYSSTFLEDVVSGVVSKIFHRVVGIVQVESTRNSEDVLFDKAESLIYWITEEFSKAQVTTIENAEERLCFPPVEKDVLKNMIGTVYGKVLEEYEMEMMPDKDFLDDTKALAGQITKIILTEIFDFQIPPDLIENLPLSLHSKLSQNALVQSLVSGELMPSSYSFPRAENIIKNVLNVILKDTNALPSCITVLPCSLIENMIYKLLVNIFPTDDTTSKLKEKEVGPDDDDEFMAAASKLTDEIIKEISEHEIRFAAEEENVESVQQGTTENFIDSVCNNILKNSEFQAEVQKDAHKKGSSFLSKMAGFIMKEIMNHHLRPFLYGEDSPSGNLPDYGRASVLAKSGKEKSQPSLFSAAFLEDVIVDLAHKFSSFATLTEDSRKKDMPEPEVESLALNFANSLVQEFRKSEIKVLPHAEEIFSFPPIGKETVNEISNSVYDQFIGKFGSDSIQKDNTGNIVIEMVSSLAQKAISSFKIQPLFSGDWCSTFFSFLDPENITQRVQLLPQKTSMQISRCLKQSQLALSKDTSMKKDDVQCPILNSIATLMKSNIINLMSGSTTGITDTKKDDENKLKSAPQKYENASKVMSPTISVKSKGTQVQHLSDKCKSNETEKENLVLINEQGQMIEIYTHFAVATVENSSEKEELVSDLVIDNESKMDNASKSIVKTDEKPKKPKKYDSTPKASEDQNQDELYDTAMKLIDSMLKQFSDAEVKVFRPEKGNEIFTKATKESEVHPVPPVLKATKDSEVHPVPPVLKVTKESVVHHPVPPVLKVTKESEVHPVLPVLKATKESEVHPVPPVLKATKESEVHPVPPVLKVTKESEVHPVLPVLKATKESEVHPVPPVLKATKESEVHPVPPVLKVTKESEVHPVLPVLKATKLSEVHPVLPVLKATKLSEIHRVPPVLKATKESEVHTVPPVLKEAVTGEPASSMTIENVDKLPPTQKATEQPSFHKIPSLHRMPSIEKSVVNKIVHSCVCNVLKECTSQESVCKNINSNGENLAKRLTSTVISEIFQHQLNLMFSDEIPASACVPLESKDVEKKVQKAVETASKECQTSSPYTIKLPFKFLDDVISALLAKVFSKLSNVKTKISQQTPLTQLDFLQMKLVNTVAAEIAKNEDMIIQYVESLHPNDDEIIQLVVQTIYNNLLPQFGTQETIQNCIASGCRLLSKTIVDLVLREVAGNQLQNYFGGELTPYQCAEVDNVVENILTNVALTTSPQPPHPRKLSYHVIEAISVKFLSKLLSVFPTVHTVKTKSPETEMQKISSKILKSIQECMSKSKIKVVKPAKELEPEPLADDATIEKVANSVYANLLKHSGSPASVFEDLMGKNNVLPDIIGSLMVKEISNSEFQAQAEEELSSSEIALEAVKIMEKVVKIIDELKSKEKSSSIKDLILDSRVLEEALALFLAKLVKKPGPESKDTDNLTKPELNKIASQLTKSVTAEISRSNISLVDSDPEEQPLDPENIEKISQVIDSVYSNIIKQSGDDNELYDMKGTKKLFPKKVASLIVNGVSNVPSCRVITKSSDAGVFGDLDTNRIIEKAQKHAARMNSDSDKELDDVVEDELPVRIIPHIGNKPLKIDPNIIAEHLAVISMKTQPLETLKMDCLKRTGYSIAELRRASISGKGHSSTEVCEMGTRQKERRISLDRTGRLDVKPLEVSFAAMEKIGQQ
ncbi:fibrous sheath-interacting protein 2 [Cricetulus griseus]